MAQALMRTRTLAGTSNPLMLQLDMEKCGGRSGVTGCSRSVSFTTALRSGLRMSSAMAKSSVEAVVSIPAKNTEPVTPSHRFKELGHFTHKQDSLHLLSGEAVLLPNGEQNVYEMITVLGIPCRGRVVIALVLLDQPIQQLVPPPLHSLGLGADRLAEHAEAS
ncbi:hypothetical protein EJB05_38050, partial [Eragrostis curvula]